MSEKRRIAELTFEPGASVALVARAHGVNANQVFKWRRVLKRGELSETATTSTSLLPIVVAAPSEAVSSADEGHAEEGSAAGGSIHIEFPGRALISVESGADASLLRSILESLRIGSICAPERRYGWPPA